MGGNFRNAFSLLAHCLHCLPPLQTFTPRQLPSEIDEGSLLHVLPLASRGIVPLSVVHALNLLHTASFNLFCPLNTLSPLLKSLQAGLTALVQSAQPGDSLLFFFAGHGCQIEDDGEEHDGFDEAICGADDTRITDDDLRDILINLPEGAKFTMISGEWVGCSCRLIPYTIPIYEAVMGVCSLPT